MDRAVTADSVFKILRTDEAAALVRDLVFTGAPVDLVDGYIHLSTAAQAPETAARHFPGQTGLWLAAVATARLGDDLRWEPSRGGDLFPHLYAPLRAAQLLWLAPLPLGPDGRHHFPKVTA